MPTTINASNTTGGAVVTGDGSGILELQSGGVTGITVNGPNVTVAGTITSTGGLASPVTVAGNSTAGAEIRLPEDTDNGSNYVAIKAPNALAANVTFTLPTADGTNGQFLRTDGSGALSFASVSPGGTTGQVQVNNAGAFGGISSGTSGQVLTSNGAGVAPSFATPNPVPGAFGQFSVAGVNADAVVFIAASASDMTSFGGWSSIQAPQYNASAGTWITSQGGGGSICYSTYYGCWFLLGTAQGGGGRPAIYASRNGLNWTLVIQELLTKMGAPTTEALNYISVDDSDGRLFITSQDATNSIGYVYFSSGTNWSSFTRTTIYNDGAGSFSEMYYIDTGSTSTSATVIVCTSGAGVTTLRTCNAGASTFTTRVTNANLGYRIVYNRQSGYALCVRDSVSVCAYFTNNNAQTGWTTNTSMGVNAGTQFAVGNGVFASTNGSGAIIYSTTGSGSWTTGATITSSTIYSLFWNGSVWVANTNSGLFTNSNTVPSGAWTQITQTGAVRLNQTSARQRYI